MLSGDGAHEPLPEGHLGQDCPPVHALLLLPSGCFYRSLTVTAKHPCSPTPGSCYTPGRERQPAEKELTFVLIGVTRVNPARSLPASSAVHGRGASYSPRGYTLLLMQALEGNVPSRQRESELEVSGK